MPSKNNAVNNLPFLQGGGETGELIRSVDWSVTPLGQPATWPYSLKQMVSMMLTNTFPTLICWGNDFTQLYNDAFRPINGEAKHPFAISNSAKNTYAEIWDSIGPMFEAVMKGESFNLQNFKVSLERNGADAEDCYFDFSYSPIKDVDGDIQGVLVICVETTEKVFALNTLKANQLNMQNMIRQAPVGICIVSGEPLYVEEVNNLFLEIVGKSREQFQSIPYWDVMKEISAVYRPIAAKVLETGETFRAKEHEVVLTRNGIPETVHVDFVYEPVRDAEEQIKGIMIVATEVTDKVLARTALEDINNEMVATNEEMAASNEELLVTNEELSVAQQQLEDSLQKLTDSEQQIRSLIESAPFPIAVYIGREMKIAQANRAIIDVWGKGSDVIGKTYFELLPELEEQEIYPQLDNVFTTAIPFHARNQRVDLTINGVLTVFYFNYSFTPLLDKNGNVYGVMNTAADVTDLNIAKQRIEQSEENFRNMIAQAPVAMCLLTGSEYIVEHVNTAMLEIWGKPRETVMNKPVFEALPDAREQGLEQVMDGVYVTGKPFIANEQPVSLLRFGKPDVVYQNFVYQPYKSTDGRILGVLAISVDVTEQVIARRELERAYEQARLSKQAAQMGTFDMNMVDGTLEWDERCRTLFGINHNNAITYEKDFVGGLHPDDKEYVLNIIDGVLDKSLTNGDYDIEYRTVGAADQIVRWVRAKGKAYFDEQDKPVRFIGSVLDITDQKLDEIRMHENAEKQTRLAAIVSSSDDTILSKTLQGIITSWNTAAERMFGYTQEEAIGKHISMIIPQSRLKEEEFIISRIKTGQKVDHFETVRIAKDGREVPLSITVSPIMDANGNIIGASKIARDISTQVEAQEIAQRYTERLEIMNTMVRAVSEELDLNRILQKVTDATTELTGAKFGAFFYNKTDEKGDSYMLFTLSGAPREAFEKFGMPRNTAVFHPTFSGEGVVRVDDITKDPRYGKNTPHHGMPKGHLPVVSYLAVPVTSRSGAVIGGLFFGHPEAGKFTKQHESLVTSIAAQAAIGIDNAKLYEEVKALNDKKDEFIGLASHELKTPLASISGYLQILNRMKKDEQSQKFVERAYHQVQKLTSLVNDLLDVSKIEAGKLKLTINEFDLKEIIEDAIELTKYTTDKYKITFETDVEVCKISADSQRIEQVVINLLTNAIKYSPGTDKVEITLIRNDKDVIVGVKDFGLGIPADKLTSIFSRFYRIDDATPNISGLGIGLYLSNEIISRHNGKLWVESELGKGSSFWFSLPLS
ncbi:PAS domain S-box protein [Taibaiella lutea]|nr:PAS domain S-box protein [Taibaiella lutea]